MSSWFSKFTGIFRASSQQNQQVYSDPSIINTATGMTITLRPASSGSTLTTRAGTVIWGGGAGGAGGAGMIVNPFTGGASYNPSTSGGVYVTFGGPPLTKEEIDELESLTKDREIELKSLRLQEFKKLPRDLRQFVINNIVWQESVNTLNSVVTPQNNRLSELEVKKGNSSNLNSYYHHGIPTTFNIPVTLPIGLTTEDLKNAHTEQTVEEELLDGQES